MNKAIKKQVTRPTDEEKLGFIQKWEKSGLSVTSWARSNSISRLPPPIYEPLSPDHARLNTKPPSRLRIKHNVDEGRLLE